MSQRDEATLPELPLGFGDLGVLRDIIQAYLAFLPGSGLSAQEKQTQMHLLKGVMFKLMDISKQTVEARIILSVGEIYALSCAIQVFIAFVRNKVSPSRERDETLQDVAHLRQCLLGLLPHQARGIVSNKPNIGKPLQLRNPMADFDMVLISYYNGIIREKHPGPGRRVLSR